MIIRSLLVAFGCRGTKKKEIDSHQLAIIWPRGRAARFCRGPGSGGFGSERARFGRALSRVHSSGSPGASSGSGGRFGAFPTASFAQYPRSGRGTLKPADSCHVARRDAESGSHLEPWVGPDRLVQRFPADAGFAAIGRR